MTSHISNIESSY